jgi:hypothetical protein
MLMFDAQILVVSAGQAASVHPLLYSHDFNQKAALLSMAEPCDLLFWHSKNKE